MEWRKSKDYPTRRHPESKATYSKLLHKSWSRAGFEREPGCAICGKRSGRGQDHIVSVSVLFKLGVPIEQICVEINSMTLCKSHHGIKTGADGRLYEGDVLEYLRRLRSGGWDMDRIEKALTHFGFKVAA